MRNLLFLVTARSGSGFLGCMLKGHFSKATGSNWLKTNPPKQCMFHPKSLVGSGSEGVNAYLMYAPTICAPSFYNNLPGDDWRFIFLLRDPRNRIESILGNRSSRTKIFSDQAKVFKFTVTHHLRGMLQDERFKVFSFEDMVVDSTKVLSEMFNFAGLQIDQLFYQNLSKQWIGNESNSSFKDKGKDANSRWHSWTSAERNLFARIAGEELVEMGFEPNHNWIHGEK